MKKELVFLTILFTLAFNIHGVILAKEQAAALAQETHQTEEPAKQITALEIRGNKSISTTVILSKIKTRAGTAYSSIIASEDLKRLYATGFFSDVNIELQPHQDGLKVIITVEEKPIIEKIVFSGMRYMREDKLREGLKSKETQYLDYPMLKDDIDNLKKTYQLKGFSETDITYKVDIDKENNKAAININIKEGKRIKIKKITFTGNSSYPSKRILKLMKTRAASLFNSGILKEEVLKEDIEKIIAFYQREGFSDVKAEYQIQYDPKSPYLYLIISIQEGKKYLVGDISIKGNVVILEEDIRLKLSDCVPPKVFSQDALQADLSNIHGLYFDKGYIFADIKPTTSFNPNTGKIDIIYDITENEVAYVNKIKIRGNNKTKDLVIRRELRIHPGERFDGEKLRRSKERIQNLGFFEEINYDYESTLEASKKDLIVEVKETKTGEFSFGGGYSTIDKLVGFVAVEQKNFDWRNWPYFTGAGQNLKVRAEIGSVREDLLLSFTEPWLFDYPVSFGFDAYRTSHDRESDVGYGYNERRTGGDLRLGKELSEYFRVDSMYKLEEVDISDVIVEATNDLKKEVGKNLISSLGLGVTYDTRDNVFNPSKGLVLNSGVDVAGGPFAGDKNFDRFTVGASRYFPIFKSNVLEFRAKAGIVSAFGDTDDVPIYERFFVGGANTIRGYQERKIGPIDAATDDPLGGESMFIGNIEYTVPLVEFIKGAVFFDTGNVWAKVGGFGSGGFKSGTGAGLRVKTPLGPVRLDYGFPLNLEPGEEKREGRFHFSMGYSF